MDWNKQENDEELLLSDYWEVSLPGNPSCRIQSAQACFSRPGFVIFALVSSNSHCASIKERLGWFHEDIEPEAFDIKTYSRGELTVLSYRVQESPKDSCPAFYAHTISAGGDLLLSMNFAEEREFSLAQEILDSVTWNVTIG